MEKIRCTLTEMIDMDILEVALDEPIQYRGFTVGDRGKQMFWHYLPTSNGYYRIYPQHENGQLGRPRYVDPGKTIVICHPIDNNPPQ